jgi:hypothetical protein
VIKRETLLAEKRAARKMDYDPSTSTIHMLLDAGLEMLDTIDGGTSQRDWVQERRTMDNQVMLALDDLQAELVAGDIERATFIVELMAEMLNEKRLGWRKEWSWYQPRIEEEFGMRGVKRQADSRTVHYECPECGVHAGHDSDCSWAKNEEYEEEFDL